jgi:hypothetical protein
MGSNDDSVTAALLAVRSEEWYKSHGVKPFLVPARPNRLNSIPRSQPSSRYKSRVSNTRSRDTASSPNRRGMPISKEMVDFRRIKLALLCKNTSADSRTWTQRIGLVSSYESRSANSKPTARLSALRAHSSSFHRSSANCRHTPAKSHLGLV